MHVSWILVAAVCCVFSTANGASIEGANSLQDAHLIGGSPVDTKRPQPNISMLVIKQGQKILGSCVATWLRQSPGGTICWFITAAECFERGLNAVQYVVRMKQNDGKFLDLPVHSNFKVYPKYDAATKKHNLAVFRAQYSVLEIVPPLVEIRSDEYVPSDLPVEIFSWKNVTRDHDIADRFEFHSLETKTIDSLWCKLMYPMSPLKEYHVCASGWFVKGLSKDQIGTPLFQRDPKQSDKFELVGIATIVRPWAPYLFFPMEFNTVAPYKSWIMASSDLKIK